MTISHRLRILLGGTAIVVVTGLVVVFLSLPHLCADSVSLCTLAGACIVLAPLFLVPAGIASLTAGWGSAWVLLVGVATIVAFPIYPILRLPRFGWVSVVGLLAWVACQMYLVLAARAL